MAILTKEVLCSISGVGPATAQKVMEKSNSKPLTEEVLTEIRGVGSSLARAIMEKEQELSAQDSYDSLRPDKDKIERFKEVISAYLNILTDYWMSNGKTVGIRNLILRQGMGEYFDDSDITAHDRRTPLTAIAKVAHIARGMGLYLMQMDITSIVAGGFIAVGEKSVQVVITRDADVSNELRDALLGYSQAKAPQGAENPIVVVAGMPAPSNKEIPVPMRVSIGRGHMIERGEVMAHGQRTGSKPRPVIGIRFNYVVSPDYVFRGVPKNIVDKLVEASMNSRRILFVGPSGSGKTTVMQAVLKLASLKNELAKFFIVGRFIEALALEKSWKMIGLPEDGTVATLPLSVQMTQRQFGGGLDSMRVLTAQGPTRLNPDGIIIDEILEEGDLNILALAVTSGVGTMATIHGRGTDPKAYVNRLRAISPDLPVPHETFADIVVGVDKRLISHISGEIEWRRGGA